jgi:hypothetical protein
MATPLILKRNPVSDNQEDYSVHSAATVKRAAHGYEATREAAMAAFAKSWRGSL